MFVAIAVASGVLFGHYVSAILLGAFVCMREGGTGE